tara:strand:- start:307 stop:570 length:264 start_codon:yes stop_codon:yes gene_type:complete
MNESEGIILFWNRIFLIFFFSHRIAGLYDSIKSQFSHDRASIDRGAQMVGIIDRQSYLPLDVFKKNRGILSYRGDKIRIFLLLFHDK